MRRDGDEGIADKKTTIGQQRSKNSSLSDPAQRPREICPRSARQSQTRPEKRIQGVAGTQPCGPNKSLGRCVARPLPQALLRGHVYNFLGLDFFSSSGAGFGCIALFFSLLSGLQKKKAREACPDFSSNEAAKAIRHIAPGDTRETLPRQKGNGMDAGAQMLGLSGEVSQADFFALCDNTHPVSKAQP